VQIRNASLQLQFEIQDDWLPLLNIEAPIGLPAYVASSDPNYPTQLIRIKNLTPPSRAQGVVGLVKERAISISDAFRSKCPIPPIEVHKPPGTCHLVVRDGYHRFYLSVAFGFSHIPVSIKPYFDVNALS
jgi:hypothetical protein